MKFLAFALAAFFLFAAPAQAQGVVNAFCSIDASWCEAAAAEFSRTTGIKVNQAHKGTGEIGAQLRAEAANPKTDIWWGGIGDPFLQAAEQGLLEPYRKRLADRVRAHIFLCTLAYYVEWHLREAWRELMFADTDQDAKATRDPVAPAKRSAAAQDKASSHTLPDGTPAHGFATLMQELANVVHNTCLTPDSAPDAPPFDVVTTAKPLHQRAFALAQAITS